jgi:hypothetical protein
MADVLLPRTASGQRRTPMKTGRSRRKTAGLLALTVIASLAVLVGSLASPARADLVTFDPTGNGGSTGASITGIQSFSYGTGNVMVQNVITAGGGILTDTPVNVFYQSALGEIRGPSGTIATVGPGGNVNNSGKEFTVVAGFQEMITGISPVPGGGNPPPAPASQRDAINIAFSPAVSNGLSLSSTSPNFFQIYAKPASTSDTPSGTGFAGGTLILEAHLVPTGFSGSFLQRGSITGGVFTSDTSAPFNQSGAPSPLDSITKTTVQGGGGTTLVAQVDSFNPLYFPPSTLPLLTLSFDTTTALPFSKVTPTDTFFGGTSSITASPGQINGSSGPDLLFSATAASSFAVIPGPSSIIPALTAATALPSCLMLLKRWRRAKPPVA